MTTPSVPPVVTCLRDSIQQLRAELFMPGYLDMETGEYVPFLDPRRYRSLWAEWRSRLARVAPPEEIEVRSSLDAHKALDSLLRRLEEVFGPPPHEVIRETWAGLDIVRREGNQIWLSDDTPMPPTASPTQKLRPCYKRDHLWLQWADGGMGAAAIRDRWNAECAQHGGKKIGAKQSGRKVVEEGLSKAKDERAAGK